MSEFENDLPEEMDAPDATSKVSIDPHYSPLPEEARALLDSGSRRGTVLVVGAPLKAADPTGAPGTRFQIYLQTRQALQGLGLQLGWVPLGYDRKGELQEAAIHEFQLQVAALGDSLAGVLLLDPGYGRRQPLWEIVTESVYAPVVWLHSSPQDSCRPADLPSNAHILEPNWIKAGQVLAEALRSGSRPQRVLLLPGPGEPDLPPQLEAVREVLSQAWGSRWVQILDWNHVFPKPLATRPANLLERALRLALRDSGLVEYDLDRFFRASLGLGADLWVCADDLLALAAMDFFDHLRLPNAPQPGLVGFGNHPFALQRGLSTVDLSWNSVVEGVVELFTGLGRRSRDPRYTVLPGPSYSSLRAHPLAP